MGDYLPHLSELSLTLLVANTFVDCACRAHFPLHHVLLLHWAPRVIIIDL
jgi:hypothetical protein